VKLTTLVADAASSAGAAFRRRGRRCYIYVRVSTAREEMIAPELQESSARRWAVAHDMEVIDVIPDLDLSGRDFAKRKIAWMIDQVKAGVADGVVVWQVSRWGRTLEQSLHHITKLQAVGGWLASATENLDEMETPFGRFNLTQLLAMAQLQSDQIRASWLSVHQRRRELGLPTTTGGRWGYTYDDAARVFVAVKAGLSIESYPIGCHVQNVDAHWLGLAYAEVIRGISMTAVVQNYRDADVRTRLGEPVTYNMLVNALDSGFGAGLISAKRDPVTGAKLDTIRYFPAAHEPVIDPDQWALFVERRSGKTPAHHKNPKSRLSGLCHCGTCGRSMNRGRPGGFFTFECPSNRAQHRNFCELKAAMREHLIREQVARWLGEQAAGDVAEHYARDERYRAASLAAIDELVGRLDELKAEERRTTRLMTKGSIDESIGRDLLAETRAEKERVTLKVAELRHAQGAVKPPPTPDMLDAARRCVLDARVSESVAAAALRHVIGKILVHPISTHGKLASQRVEIVPAWSTDDESPAGELGVPSSIA
jgi:site-specific DNA recombinase